MSSLRKTGPNFLQHQALIQLTSMYQSARIYSHVYHGDSFNKYFALSHFYKESKALNMLFFLIKMHMYLVVYEPVE